MTSHSDPIFARLFTLLLAFSVNRTETHLVQFKFTEFIQIFFHKMSIIQSHLDFLIVLNLKKKLT